MSTESTPTYKELHRGDPIVSRVPFYYGWVMMVVSLFALIFTSPGQTFGIAVFNPSFREALNLTHTQLTGAYMVATLLAAVPLSMVGGLMDRFGIRRMMTIVVLLLGVACIFISQVTGLLMLFFAFFWLRLLGQGSLTLLADNTLAMWFQTRLGTVAGLRSVGVTVATAFVPALILSLIHTFGWRWAYALLGLLVWAVMLPQLALLFRNRPEDVGQVLDGVKETGDDDTNDKPQSPSSVVRTSRVPYDLKGAMHTRAYWILLLMNAIWGMVITAITFNILPLFMSRGLAEGSAVAILAAMSISSAAFQIIAGILADRLPLNLLLSLGFVAMTVGVGFLIALGSVIMGYAFAIVMGLGSALLGAVSATVWVRYYGRTHLGKIRGSVWTATVAASSLGPFLMGITYDRINSYTPVLVFYLCLFAVIVVAVMFATPPKPIPAS
ncbi:MAG: MFS transporter [Anaerolineales bacterium]|nr:MFS transporter [Anaerolineales bacterium]